MAEQNNINDVVEIPPVGRCQSYLPGHQSHWIMVQMYRSAPSRSAVVRQIRGTEITLQAGDEALTWRHHEPERLRAALHRLPRSVRILDQCTAILVDRGSGTYWFYCAPGSMEDCISSHP